MAERRSHQCEIMSLIDPQRKDLQNEAVILLYQSCLEIEDAANEILDIEEGN